MWLLKKKTLSSEGFFPALRKAQVGFQELVEDVATGREASGALGSLAGPPDGSNGGG